MYPFDRNGYPIYPGCVVLDLGLNSVWVVTYCKADPCSWTGFGVWLNVSMMTDNEWPLLLAGARSETALSFETWQIVPYLEVIERHVV